MPDPVKSAADVRRNNGDFVVFVWLALCTRYGFIYKGEGAGGTSAFTKSILEGVIESSLLHMANKPSIHYFAKCFSQYTE